jgi:hypothetical protein
MKGKQKVSIRKRKETVNKKKGKKVLEEEGEGETEREQAVNDWSQLALPAPERKLLQLPLFLHSYKSKQKQGTTMEQEIK